MGGWGGDGGRIRGSAEGCWGRPGGRALEEGERGPGWREVWAEAPRLPCFASLSPVFSVKEGDDASLLGTGEGWLQSHGGEARIGCCPQANERRGQGVGVSGWSVAGDWDLFIAEDTH